MASIINASTAAGGGVITTADASGVLQVQTGGVTAMQVDASQNVTFTNPVSANGMTLLGTLTTTSGNSQSLTSLTLTNYKQLIVAFNGISADGNSAVINISTTTSGGTSVGTLTTGTTAYNNNISVDLTSGSISGGFSSSTSGITTASTQVTIYITNVSFSFDAGNVKIYGVR